MEMKDMQDNTGWYEIVITEPEDPESLFGGISATFYADTVSEAKDKLDRIAIEGSPWKIMRVFYHDGGYVKSVVSEGVA